MIRKWAHKWTIFSNSTSIFLILVVKRVEKSFFLLFAWNISFSANIAAAACRALFYDHCAEHFFPSIQHSATIIYILIMISIQLSHKWTECINLQLSSIKSSEKLFPDGGKTTRAELNCESKLNLIKRESEECLAKKAFVKNLMQASSFSHKAFGQRQQQEWDYTFIFSAKCAEI